MLYVFAHNTTPESKLDGRLHDYDVQVNLNEKCLWRGSVKEHVRAAGAGTLLHMIADKLQAAEQIEGAMPILTRILMDANVHPTFKKPLVDVSKIPASRVCSEILDDLQGRTFKSKGRSVAATMRRKKKNDGKKLARLRAGFNQVEIVNAGAPE